MVSHVIDRVQCDPEAARAIFMDPVLAAKSTLIPLDVTHQALVTEEVQQKFLRGSSSSVSQLDNPHATPEAMSLRPMLYGLLTFFASTYANVFGLTSGPPLHDPIAVAVLLFDQAKEDLEFDDRGGERWHVSIIIDSHQSEKLHDRGGQIGRTVIIKAEKDEGGVRIPRALNVKRFWDVIDECIQRAEGVLNHSVNTSE